MNYNTWVYEHDGELFLEVTEEELVELAKDFNVLSFYPNGESVGISKVAKEVNELMYRFHDINLRLIHPQG